MSITDELREWAEGDALRAGMSLRTARDQALAIADRIDAEHQKAIRELNNLAEASVLLPVDADGEPIHVGDRLTDGEYTFAVCELATFGDGSWSIRNDDGNAWAACDVTHHVPTVEDVLFSYGQACIRTSNEAETDAAKQTMLARLREEYAAKLRLAEGEDV